MYEENQDITPTRVSYRNFFHDSEQRANIYFTQDWAKVGSGWAAGKHFKIAKSIPVNYPVTRDIPQIDYLELDLSNATNGMNLYPEVNFQAMEILVGFKPGNYVIQIDIPNGTPLAKLPESSMFPSKTDATNKYINAKEPSASPFNNPTIKFWVLKDSPAIILRPVVLSGCSYERVSMEFKTVRHLLTELKTPPSVYDTVEYPEALRF